MPADPASKRHALVAKARSLVGEFSLTKPSLTAAAVGAALETASGTSYTGINLDLACGIGFCAEHAAVAEMLKARETVVRSIVAVNEERIVAPCGRCRELLVQVDPRNLDCVVLLPDDRSATLRELLPDAWLEQLLVQKRA
ncbi:MAG TPA: cytidine deaminase [Casimicrobiaceae bacterium]|nr:cytidine deaminase [Casimicrobiaceae bacterium]